MAETTNAATAKVVSMRARPWKAVHLCFEIGGILESLEPIAQLGAQIPSFNFSNFYTKLVDSLGNIPKATNPISQQPDLSLLLYNFSNIDSDKDVMPCVLARLRREPQKAALNNAVLARQNAYFAKYQNQADVIQKMRDAYTLHSLPSIFPLTSKPDRLRTLSQIATDQWSALSAAYVSDPSRNPNPPGQGVVKSTESVLCSDTASYGYSATSGVDIQGSMTVQDEEKFMLFVFQDPPRPQPAPSWPAPCQQSETTAGSRRGAEGTASLPLPQPPTPPTNVKELFYDQFGLNSDLGTAIDQTIQGGTNYQVASNSDRARQSQTIVNTDYGFRIPYKEAEAQFHRAQISLIDQQFAQFMQGQNLSFLETVFDNEVKTMDRNVVRLQVAYLSALLMSPVAGVVSGIYKSPGDAVRAGEPVIRVEDNSKIYLVATIIYRGPIAVCPPAPPPPAPPPPPPPYSRVTVHTNLFGIPGPRTPIEGKVVSARCHGDDDKWDIVVLCVNPLDASGNPTFPLNYRFDYDDTDMLIV